MENVKFVGLSEVRVSDAERQKIFDTAVSRAGKYHNYIKNEHELVVHVKEHEPDGGKHRYEIHARISYPGDTLAVKTEEWNVVTGVQRALDELEEVLMHRYRTNARESASAAQVYEAPGVGTR